MGYAEKNLVPGESIVYRARYHWIIYRLGILLLLLAILLGVSSLYAARTSPGSGVVRTVGLLALAFLALAAGALASRWFSAEANREKTDLIVIRTQGRDALSTWAGSRASPRGCCRSRAVS